MHNGIISKFYMSSFVIVNYLNVQQAFFTIKISAFSLKCASIFETKLPIYRINTSTFHTLKVTQKINLHTTFTLDFYCSEKI